MEAKLRPCYEPIYASCCLFTFIGEELHRITESFCIDLTPNEIRGNYSYVYLGKDARSQPVQQMFLSLIPEELKDSTVYFVVQLSKLLSADGDKAVSPYLPRASAAEAKKTIFGFERLSKYRQPLGVGAVKLEKDKVTPGMQFNISFPVFSLKTCCSDPMFAQVSLSLSPHAILC
jgi:hypothetical protein